jgi:hypothetical protein
VQNGTSVQTIFNRAYAHQMCFDLVVIGTAMVVAPQQACNMYLLREAACATTAPNYLARSGSLSGSFAWGRLIPAQTEGALPCCGQRDLLSPREGVLLTRVSLAPLASSTKQSTSNRSIDERELWLSASRRKRSTAKWSQHVTSPIPAGQPRTILQYSSSRGSTTSYCTRGTEYRRG